MQNEPEPGEYTHYKGGHYTVLFVATDSTDGFLIVDKDHVERNGRRVVVYVSHSGAGVRLRDVEQWNDLVDWPDGSKGPRFRLIAP